MARDFYEVLGVAPTSEDVVIRAAYRALMRRYHPDKGPDADMSGRAREINAAYAVLGNPDKRARYDGSLAAAGLVKPGGDARRAFGLSAVARPGPGAIALFVTVAGLALMFALSPPLAQMPGAPALLGQGPQAPPAPAALPAREESAAVGAPSDCGGDQAAELIKDELFRRAALLRGREGGRFRTAAAGSLVRMHSEAAAGAGGPPGRCSGWIALDLPPGLVVEGGRRNLNSAVDYALAAGAGGTARLADVAGADALVATLATLAPEAAAGEGRDGPPIIKPASPPAAPALPAVRAASATRDPPAHRAAAASARSRPASRSGGGCRYATGRTATAICGSANLAALDRSLEQFYDQSLSRADAPRKAHLLSSNDGFATRRNACRTQSCLTAAYLARMREVSAIMAKPQQP